MMIDNSLFEMNTEIEIPPSVFWALDSRLPRTAAQAAVEFDWLIQTKRGKDIPNLSRESINKLAWLLEESFGKALSKSTTYVDSMGLSLFAKAYNKTHKTHYADKREELAPIVKDIIASLKKAGQEENINNIEDNDLADMKDFCMVLSENAAICRDMVSGNRQKYPY